MKCLCFSPSLIPSRIWTLLYSYLHRSNKNLASLLTEHIGNIGYKTKAFSKMSYLRMVLDSDVTRHFQKTVVDFMEPMLIKTSWENWLCTRLRVFTALQMTKESNFSANSGNLRYFEVTCEERNLPKLIDTKGEIL